MSVSQVINYEAQAATEAELKVLRKQVAHLTDRVTDLESELAWALDELDWARSDRDRAQQELSKYD
jgi:ubiquinone biosynthesis protein UbiJ